MRVLHVVAGNLYGGVEALLCTLARHQRLFSRVQNRFALCFAGRLSSELERAGARPVLLGPARVRRPWSVLRARSRLAPVVRGFDLVVCHSAWTHALFAPVVRAAGAPLVTFLHNETSGRHWLERWAARTPPDLVLCNSEFTRRGAALAFPGVRSEVWRPMVPAASGRDGADVQRVREELAVSRDAVLIVQTGRFERLKGQERHLRALASLRDLPAWHCVQLGEPQTPAEQTYFAGLRQLAAQLGIEQRVSFAGFREDVGRVLAAADIYCQPNIGADSFGLSLAEALATGLPVVTSDLGAARELVADGGVLVRTDAELSAALRELVESRQRREDLAARAVARWRSQCDPVRQIPALETVLSSVTLTRPPGRVG